MVLIRTFSQAHKESRCCIRWSMIYMQLDKTPFYIYQATREGVSVYTHPYSLLIFLASQLNHGFHKTTTLHMFDFAFHLVSLHFSKMPYMGDASNGCVYKDIIEKETLQDIQGKCSIHRIFQQCCKQALQAKC